MRRLSLTLLTTLCLSCGGDTKVERAYTRGAPALSKPTAPDPSTWPSKTGLYRKPRVARKPIDVGEIVQLGRDTQVAEEKLADAYSVVFMLQCLERYTKKPVDGDIMVSHIRRNTTAARTCVSDYKAQSKESLAAQAIAWTAEQEKARERN